MDLNDHAINTKKDKEKQITAIKMKYVVSTFSLDIALYLQQLRYSVKQDFFSLADIRTIGLRLKQ